MTYLIKDIPRDYELGEVNAYLIAEHVVIYEGAAVGADNRGYARPLEAGDLFLGFCEQQAAYNAGNERVRVKAQGKIKLSVENVTLLDIGKAVFATDDNNFTLTPDKNSLIGWVYRVESPGVCIVTFRVAQHG